LMTNSVPNMMQCTALYFTNKKNIYLITFYLF